MSVLINESYANPTTGLWLTTQPSKVSFFQNYDPSKTVTVPVANPATIGTYVVTPSVSGLIRMDAVVYWGTTIATVIDISMQLTLNGTGQLFAPSFYTLPANALTGGSTTGFPFIFSFNGVAGTAYTLVLTGNHSATIGTTTASPILTIVS